MLHREPDAAAPAATAWPPQEAADPFHACPEDPGCAYCGLRAGERAPALDWSFVDAVFCISLVGRDDRMRHAATQFHRTGLCRKVVFYRPEPDPCGGVAGCWESHRAVAGLALGLGAGRVLVFEDDVLFDRPITPRTLRAVAAALDALPPQWTIFYLGHWPLRAYAVRRNVLRSSSGCAHAYIASRRLLLWLRDHPWEARGVAKHPLVGRGVDAAFALLPHAYAYFPMLAVQAPSSSDTLTAAQKTKPKRKRRLRHLVTHSRHREWLLYRLMRPAELAAVLLSPFWWLAERLRPRLSRLDAAGAPSAATTWPQGSA